MKRWTAMMLALMMAFTLTACSKNTGETENGKTPEEPSGQGEISGQEDQPPEEPLYVFLGGYLAGSWENGQWVSAVPLGEQEDGNFVSAGDGETREFTVAEILDQEGYYLYTPEQQGDLCTQCEFYTISDGYSLEEHQPGAAALLDPYASVLPEGQWGRRTFAFPTLLEGEAADVTMPDYSFDVSFEGIWPELALSQPLSSSVDFGHQVEDSGENAQTWREIAEAALADLGIDEDFRLTAAGTGQEGEIVLAVNSACDEGGYWLEESEQVFSLVLYVRADGTVETVYQRVEPYTGDVVAVFRIFFLGVCDLNGDGQAEICLKDGRWEWGYNYVMARGEDGAWQRVLQANHGM